MPNLIWIIVVVLVIAWILGFSVFHVGSLIHLLLLIALVLVIYRLATGRKVI
jgi:hypothetical protein